ncbi:MAG: STAS domain-containing protein [Leptospirales bacterium]
MNIENVSGVHVIEPVGNITQNETDELEHALHGLYEIKEYKAVVDMRKVENLCSSALGILVSYKRTLSENGGDLKLIIDTPQLQELFNVTMLNKVFDIGELPDDIISLFLK